jgi:hypothetical protein
MATRGLFLILALLVHLIEKGFNTEVTETTAILRKLRG